MDMSKIGKMDQLELKKMMKELDYLLTEEEYKNEVIGEFKPEFLEKVGSLKEEEPKPKEPDAAPSQEPEADSEEEGDSPDVPEDPAESYAKEKSKRIYREIAKSTHPDKSSSEGMVELYIKAKKAYSERDLISLYRICDELGISYSIDIEDKELLRSKIEGLKKMLKGLESSFIWIYAEARTDEERQSIIDRFRQIYGAR